MARAVCPQAEPPLPEGAIGWARSTKRAGSMYHAHALGFSVCGSVVLDRHASEEPRGLGDMQYWGICPRCYAKSKIKGW